MYDYIVYVQRSGDQSEEPTGVPVRAPFGRCIGSSHASTYIFGAVEYSRSLRQSSSSCVVPQHETRTLRLQYVFCGGLAACSLLANDQRKLVWKCESYPISLSPTSFASKNVIVASFWLGRSSLYAVRALAVTHISSVSHICCSRSWKLRRPLSKMWSWATATTRQTPRSRPGTPRASRRWGSGRLL